MLSVREIGKDPIVLLSANVNGEAAKTEIEEKIHEKYSCATTRDEWDVIYNYLAANIENLKKSDPDFFKSGNLCQQILLRAISFCEVDLIESFLSLGIKVNAIHFEAAYRKSEVFAVLKYQINEEVISEWLLLSAEVDDLPALKQELLFLLVYKQNITVLSRHSIEIDWFIEGIKKEFNHPDTLALTFAPGSQLYYFNNSGIVDSIIIEKKAENMVLIAGIGHPAHWVDLTTDRHLFSSSAAQSHPGFIHSLQQTFLMAKTKSEWDLVFLVLKQLPKSVKLNLEFLRDLLRRFIQTNFVDENIQYLLSLLKDNVVYDDVLYVRSDNGRYWVKYLSPKNISNILFQASDYNDLYIIKLFHELNLIPTDILQDILIQSIIKSNLSMIEGLISIGASLAQLDLRNTFDSDEYDTPLSHLELYSYCDVLFTGSDTWSSGKLKRRDGNRIFLESVSNEGEWINIYDLSLASNVAKDGVKTSRKVKSEKKLLSWFITNAFLNVIPASSWNFVCSQLPVVLNIVADKKLYMDSLFTKALSEQAEVHTIKKIISHPELEVTPKHIALAFGHISAEPLAVILQVNKNVNNDEAFVKACQDACQDACQPAYIWPHVSAYAANRVLTPAMYQDAIENIYQSRGVDYFLKSFIESYCKVEPMQKALHLCAEAVINKVKNNKNNSGNLSFLTALFVHGGYKLSQELLLSSKSEEEWEFILDYLRQVKYQDNNMLMIIINLALGQNKFKIAHSLLMLLFDQHQFPANEREKAVRLLNCCGDYLSEILAPTTTQVAFGLFGTMRGITPTVKFTAALRYLEYMITGEKTLSELEYKARLQGRLLEILGPVVPESEAKHELK